MAFPQVHEITATTDAGDTSTYAANMPATVNAGDMLVLLVCAAGTGSTVPATPSGWSARATQASNGNYQMGIFVKEADGTEDGTTVTIDFTTARTSFSSQCYRIQVGTWRDSGTLLNDIEHTIANQISTNPDSASLNPANWDVEDTLWITTAMCGQDGNLTAGPTNYTNFLETDSVGSGNRANIGSARRELAAASEDPGAFTATTGSINWAVSTLAIRPAVAVQTNFPQRQTRTDTLFTTATTAHAVSMPSIVNVDELLIATIVIDDEVGGGGTTITTPSGWTSIGGILKSGVFRLAVYARAANGLEGGSTVDFVTSQATEMAAQVHRYVNWFKSGTLTNDVELATFDAGSTSTPDPPSLNPTNWDVEKTAWMAIGARRIDHNVSSYPSTYTGTAQTKTTTPGVNLATAIKENESASEDPGTFTYTGSTTAAAATLAIRPGNFPAAVSSRFGKVSMIYFQVPAAPPETPPDPRFARITMVYFQVPEPSRRAIVTMLFLGTPDVGGGGTPAPNTYVSAGVRNSLRGADQ